MDREKERSLWQFGYSDGSYKSFTNLIQNIFKGEDTGTVKKLEQMLTIISNELMPELNLENNPEAPEEKKTAR